METKLNAKQIAFLSAYRKFGSVGAAAAGANVSRRSHYCWLEQVEYAEAFQQACEKVTDCLIAEIRACASEQMRKPDANTRSLAYLSRDVIAQGDRTKVQAYGPTSGNGAATKKIEAISVRPAPQRDVDKPVPDSSPWARGNQRDVPICVSTGMFRQTGFVGRNLRTGVSRPSGPLSRRPDCVETCRS